MHSMNMTDRVLWYVLKYDFFRKKNQLSAIACSSALFSQLLLMMSWQLMARKMMIRGHFLRVVCCVKLCCGVLHYDVLCGRMKIRGHFYTRAADLSAKRGWGVFAVWWRVFLLTWWCSKYSPQHPFSLLNLLFAEKYKQGFQTLGAFLRWRQ